MKRLFSVGRKGAAKNKKSDHVLLSSKPNPPAAGRKVTPKKDLPSPVSSESSSPAVAVAETKTRTNDQGKRVVTTTVHIPAPAESKPAVTQESYPPPLRDVDEMEEKDRSVTELTRSLVKKFIADIWNRGEVDLIPEVCSPSLRFNG
jgi:hypothetical protein